ncbi:hypothetical protein PC116_g30663 [Phytophthora cactorum]|nr:hypothetical protein PC116_g30663 [Phytophthora cactorum]
MDIIDTGFAMCISGVTAAMKKYHAAKAISVWNTSSSYSRKFPTVATKPHIQYTIEPNATVSPSAHGIWLAEQANT